MKYKKIMLVTFLLLAILTVSAVSAEDNATSDVVSLDDNNVVEVADDDLSAGASDSNFTQLDNDIISGDGNLTHDYAFDPDTESDLFDDGLKINKSIDGHGHIIDFARSEKSIIIEGYDVVVSNLVFKNSGNTAVFCIAHGGTLLNCTFINCGYNESVVGAVKWDGENGAMVDCNFIECEAHWVSWQARGTVWWTAVNGRISNSRFTDCWSGGSSDIYWEGANGIVDGCYFDNSSGGLYGAVYWVGENGTVTGSYFNNCYAYRWGGAIYWDADNGTVANCNFDKCHSQDFGGAIRWDDSYGGTNGIVTGCNFTNCFVQDNVSTSGEDGGAVCWNADDGALTNCYFFNCSAQAVGGAVAWYGGHGNISDSNFISCSAQHAGAVYWSTTTNNTVLNCNFINCSAKEYGGAIRWYLSRGYVYGCNFTNCYAGYGGGALHNLANLVYGSAFGEEIPIYNSNFIDCSAAAHGGAIGGGKVNVSNSNFTNCSANGKFGGGAISSQGSAVNCTFINNSATDSTWGGGAICDCSAIDCTFIDNYANMDGGAMRSASAVNSIFINNHANTYGGAISGGSAVNCTFINNSALGTNGGAIYGGSAENSVFINNYANNSGGAICNYYSGVKTITNCSFINNTADAGNGGAVYAEYDRSVVNDCTFINNSADNGRGGAISYARVRNCTFFNNTAASNNNWYDTIVPYLNLLVSDFNSTYGFGESVFFNASDDENPQNDVSNVIITVRIYSNGTLVKTIDCLANNYWIVDLDAGDYTAEMAIEHNAYVLKKSVKITLTIAKMPTEITSADISTVYGEDGNLMAILKDIKGNFIARMPVSVDLNGVGNYTTDENGTVKVSTKGLNANTYPAVIDFAGNNNYENSSAIANVTVVKAATLLSSAAVSTVYNGGKNLVVTLKDANGNNMSGAKISININGAKFVTTDKNGQAKLTTNGYAPKTYTAKIKFAGDDNYNASSTTAKVTIKKATVKLTAKAKTFKRSVKTKKYSVTLKTNRNKVMKNTKVTLKVNKITYTAKTNSKGVATFKITKLTKKGKYAATVKYAGSKYYNTKSVKVKITVK